jgi:hypothetical protein
MPGRSGQSFIFLLSAIQRRIQSAKAPNCSPREVGKSAYAPHQSGVAGNYAEIPNFFLNEWRKVPIAGGMNFP